MLSKSYFLNSYLPPSFYASFGFSLATLIFALMAFLAPYWIESYDIVHSEFVRIGIWMGCFNGFRHPQDYNARYFHGCIWLYDPVLGDLWFYLNPWWLVAVQVLLTVAVGLHFSCFLAYCAYYWFRTVRIDIRVCATMSCAVAQLFSSICWATTIILYGIESQNRLWIPRPDQNLISWGYWSATVCCVCSICAGVSCIIQTRELNMLKEEEQRARMQLANDPFAQSGPIDPYQYNTDVADGSHEAGVLQIGALPVDYEKDSQGVFLSSDPIDAQQYSSSRMNIPYSAAGGSGSGVLQ